MWLLDGENKCDDVAVSIEYRRVTDGRTDGDLATAHIAVIKSFHIESQIESPNVLKSKFQSRLGFAHRREAAAAAAEKDDNVAVAAAAPVRLTCLLVRFQQKVITDSQL